MASVTNVLYNIPMFRAINDYIIVIRNLEDKKTESGIILTAMDETQVLELEVHSVSDAAKGLEGKTVYAERHKVKQLTPGTDRKYGSVKLEDILAVKE